METKTSQQKKAKTPDSIVENNSFKDVIKKLRPAKMTTVLLYLYDEYLKNRKTSDIFKQYKESRFLSPARISQREMLKIDRMLYQVTPRQFEDIIISPVAPLGINKALTNIDQNKVLSAVRNIEVVSAITPTLAAESAKRRQEKNYVESEDGYVHLCTSHRNIRAQMFEQNKSIDGLEFTPHFQLFCLSSSGYSSDNTEFSGKMLDLHLRIILNFFRIANQSDYFEIKNITISVSDILIAERLIKKNKIDREVLKVETTNEYASIFKEVGLGIEDRAGSILELDHITNEKQELEFPFRNLKTIGRTVLENLQKDYQEVVFDYHLSRIAGIGYFNGLCYKIYAENKAGKVYPLVDGGSCDWVSKFIPNKKERFFSTGFGSELFGRFFKK